MIEKVIDNETLYAIIIRASFQNEGAIFFTPGEFSQQLGYMNRPKGYTIPAHRHVVRDRQVTLTQEVLFIRKGKVRVDFFRDDHCYLRSCILETGDFILLAAGGHGLEMLEQSEIVEVKQGPYFGDQDKLKFDDSDKDNQMR